MASNILRFPNGSGCRLWVIANVVIEDSGVVCYDSNNRNVGSVQCSDNTINQCVAGVILDCLDAGARFQQPDWSKLLRGVAA